MRAFLSVLLTLVLAACAPESADVPPEGTPGTPDASAGTPASASRVQITSPADGDTVDGPELTVTLEVAGVQIVPAGDTTSGTGHHHLYLDADLTPPGEPVPTVPGSIIHMGDGSGSYTFAGVEPGEHRVIAVVADGVHVPLQPWVVDTVHVVVR